MYVMFLCYVMFARGYYQWLVGLSDTQTNIRFAASKIAEGFLDLLNRSALLRLFSFYALWPLKRHLSLAGILHIDDIFSLKRKRKKGR